jgi:hypothetical protein
VFLTAKIPAMLAIHIFQVVAAPLINVPYVAVFDCFTHWLVPPVCFLKKKKAALSV